MITDIRLHNFRSYADDSFEFSPKVNIIVGPNASGKTNLLEAILVISRGSSFRAKDNELVQFNKPWGRLEAHAATGDRVVKIKYDGNRVQKQFEINDQTYTRLSPQKTLPVVLFEPEHLQILNGQPEVRRQFLDDLLEMTTPGFISTRRQYKRALSQRNYLLKRSQKADQAQFFVWDVRLSELGSKIAEARYDLIEKMNNKAQDLYNRISGKKEKVKFEYTSRLPIKNYASSLLQNLEVNLPTDLERGFTSFGPHRDDLLISLNGHLAQESASRGEMRTLLLVCKILETQLLEETNEVKPILLLDDVFSELDGKRRQTLTNFLQDYQAFITTTDADVVIQHFTESAKIVPIG